MESITRKLPVFKENTLLLGPRGTGKSFYIKKNFPDAFYIDLLLPDVYLKYSSHPEYLAEVAAAQSEKQIFIIDEVQKVPELLTVIHALIEKNKKWQFILTGSSARKLKKTGVNLLAGRAIAKTMHPFTAIELKQHFNLEKALTYGLLPIVWNSESLQDTLNTYLALYIKEEVQQEGLTRNIGNFHRFLEAISFSYGSVLNVSNIARDCHVERKVVESYISILEDLLISFTLPVFTKKAKRIMSQTPKFYLFDCGIYRTLRPKGPLDQPEEIYGLALEGLIAQNIRAILAYKNTQNKLFFWRTKSGLEIDFIVYGENSFCAIEVKNSKQIRPKDLRSLKEFQKDYPQANLILVYRGKDKFLRDNILIIPAEEFLHRLDNYI